MSRIYPHGSGTEYKTVGFNDLETIAKSKGSFFVTKIPACGQNPKDQKSRAEGGAAAGEEKTSNKKDLSADKTTDVDALKEESYSKGRQAGRNEAEKAFHNSVQSLASALEQVSRMRESIFGKSREDMARLVMGVARQVIRSEVRENETIILKTITSALEAAVPSDEYYIRINPDDLKVVTDSEPMFLASMKGLKNVHFISDENISRGGCMAESRGGDVDATIESQLNEIYEHLRTENTEKSRETNG